VRQDEDAERNGWQEVGHDAGGRTFSRDQHEVDDQRGTSAEHAKDDHCCVIAVALGRGELPLIGSIEDAVRRGLEEGLRDGRV